MSTPDHKVAEAIGRSIDGRIFRLAEERKTLEQAAARIAEIDAELVELHKEKQRIDPRRPPKPVDPGGGNTLPSGDVKPQPTRQGRS